MQKLVKRYSQIARELERVKPLYREMDEIALEIKRAMGRKRYVKVGRKTYHLKDNFSSVNTVFRATGIRRFEIEEIDT
jgi:hypothetical protein